MYGCTVMRPGWVPVVAPDGTGVSLTWLVLLL